MDLPESNLRLWAQRRELDAILAALAACTDEELQRLSLTRADTPHAAHAEAWRRLSAGRMSPTGPDDAASQPPLASLGIYRAQGTWGDALAADGLSRTSRARETHGLR